MDIDLLALQDQTQKGSALLKAMSNEHRLLILCQLMHRERSVGELERVVGLSQSALSQHLARLRKDGVVKTRRQAQTIYYSLNGPQAGAILRVLHSLYCEDADTGPSRGHKQAGGQADRA
ncbi:ArsR family transcriptional regulator [Rhodospirillum rubrum]|uniref:ArsR/SmtB family transcription factor n=1 Tax=Rhodospirillum rubrum TaxID=1085 RepID=UPI001905321A|nr:metalloregulator ArsR/SmtB family transcription factor [Rhodospirillum rubrum]MBK1665865.1 ArsR family transcriptional regulator [Rhodospirillum rubrum]MBK1677614.1 ArsR family transcriptional regulator [Rhodospirillum rubrum]